MVWLPGNLTGRGTVQHIEQRPRHLAEDVSLARRVGGRHASGRHAALGLHAADGGQRDGAEQLAAAAGRTSNWFRAKRPSGHGAQGAGLSVPAPGVADSVPATPSWNAFGASAQQALGLDSWPDDGVRVAEKAHTPVRGDHTGAGLPTRIPGANLIPGSVSGRAADGLPVDETQAFGRRTGNSGAEQVMPSRQTPLSRRSPELARNRLSGFQLGSREAET